MELLKYEQVKRFSLLSQKRGKYIVNLTQDYKKHAYKDELIKTAIIIFGNIQRATGSDPRRCL